MKKREWIRVLLAATVLLSCLAIASPAPAATPAVKVIKLSGAATAAIPIEVPPGRAGLQPKLNLTYHSYKKNGWIGVGWDLSMGAITRSTKRGVDYDAFDFVANGQELVPVDIDSAGNGTYQARIEGGFALYEFNHETGWVMKSKDGTTFYYGQDTDSRQDDPSILGRVFKWCLDKVKDANGNYMLVSYDKDQGQIYLKQIDYTGNEGSSPQPTTNKVIFHSVEGRPDTDKLFTTNFEVVTAKRLNSIDVLSDGAQVGAYQLNYVNSSDTTSRSLLTEVKQYGTDAVLDGDGNVTDGSSLPTIAFEYSSSEDDGAFEPFITTTHATSGYNSPWEFSFADVNGDGRADAIAYLIGTGSGTRLHVALSDGQGGFGDFVTTTHATSGYSSAWRFYFTDVNGDGRADAIAYLIGTG